MRYRYTILLDDPTVDFLVTGYYDARRPADAAADLLDCDPSRQFDRGPVYVRTVLGIDLRRYREYAIRYASGALSTVRVWVCR